MIRPYRHRTFKSNGHILLLMLIVLVIFGSTAK